MGGLDNHSNLSICSLLSTNSQPSSNLGSNPSTTAPIASAIHSRARCRTHLTSTRRPTSPCPPATRRTGKSSASATPSVASTRALSAVAACEPPPSSPFSRPVVTERALLPSLPPAAATIRTAVLAPTVAARLSSLPATPAPLRETTRPTSRPRNAHPRAARAAGPEARRPVPSTPRAAPSAPREAPNAPRAGNPGRPRPTSNKGVGGPN